MFSKLKIKDESSRNVIRLVTGTTISYAIPIAMSPILTRIYSPEEFGVFALFMALSSTLGTIINGRYELAIILPEDDKEAFNIAFLGLVIASIFSLFLLIIVILLNQEIATLLGSEDLKYWLYFIPVSVLLVGFYNVLIFSNNRLKKFNDIAKAGIYKAFVLVAIQISIGLTKGGSIAGLVSGQILSIVFGNIRLLKNVFYSCNFEADISFSEMKRMALRYYRFPKYSILSGLANTLSTHAVNILDINILFGYDSRFL